MNEVDRQTPIYPMGVVQKLTGLTGRQIRYYEEQGLISPHRTKGNRRMYSAAEVSVLLRIKHLREQGYNIDGIKQALKSDLPPDVNFEQESSLDLMLEKLGRPTKLTSLYPISNRSELERLLRDHFK